MKITIITVVKNNPLIERCILSVINQTYKNFEYIIIDGSSTDGTCDVIKKYRDHIDHYVSESDSGIYEAMNKGGDLATGDYLLFLNSDDWLISNDALSKVVIQADTTKDLIICQMEHSVSGRLLINSTYPSNKFVSDSMSPPHPATFINSKLWRSHRYLEVLKYAGDYYLWRELKACGHFNFQYIPISISVFELGGISSSGTNEDRVIFELEFINYIKTKNYSISRLIYSKFKTIIKRILLNVLGAEKYYKGAIARSRRQ